MKFLRNKLIFGKEDRHLPCSFLPFSLPLCTFCLVLFIVFVASCAADNSAMLLKDLKTGSYDFFLKTDNTASRSVKKMGYGSAYYIGLHLKRAGHAQAARYYFTLGEKWYEMPFKRLCHDELYKTGTAADCLQSVQARLQELEKASGTAAQTEKDLLTFLEIRFLLQTGAYDKVKQTPETLYLTDRLTAELVDAFPQFGSGMTPFLQKLAESRIRVFEKRYAEAWDSVQTAFGMEHAFAGLAFPALLSDIGKAGVYGAEPAVAAAFFEDFAERIRKAASLERFEDGAERRCLFYAFFYAARCRAKMNSAQQRELAAERFLQAAELAGTDSELDSALWYYLDTLQRFGRSRYLRAFTETAARWKNPLWYDDLVQSLRAQLTAEKDWEGLQRFHEVLVKTRLPEQRAAVAYTLARSGSLPQDQAERLLQDAAGQTHDSLYYRLLAAYQLGAGEPLLFLNKTEVQRQAADGKKKTGEFSVQEMRMYIDGLLRFGLYDMLYPQLAAMYPFISAGEAVQIASALEEAGLYADSIRLVSLSLKNQEGEATEEQLRLLYPRPWRELVRKYAAEYRLPEYLLYALIRSESFFQPRIVSGAGAVGLTQLMPATAADIAKKFKMSDYELTDPEINIRFGAYYLAEMIRRSDNRIMPACFAYNAGLSRVRSWLRRAQGLSADLFLESLEYAETREYGRKILSAAAVYGSLYYSEKPEDIILLFFPNLQKR